MTGYGTATDATYAVRPVVNGVEPLGAERVGGLLRSSRSHDGTLSAKERK
jgi:hypothetical protein